MTRNVFPLYLVVHNNGCSLSLDKYVGMYVNPFWEAEVTIPSTVYIVGLYKNTGNRETSTTLTMFYWPIHEG